MNNTIQLYTDHTKTVMGYPITTPDRVMDESGENIEEKINTINEQLDDNVSNIILQNNKLEDLINSSVNYIKENGNNLTLKNPIENGIKINCPLKNSIKNLELSDSMSNNWFNANISDKSLTDGAISFNYSGTWSRNIAKITIPDELIGKSITLSFKSEYTISSGASTYVILGTTDYKAVNNDFASCNNNVNSFATYYTGKTGKATFICKSNTLLISISPTGDKTGSGSVKLYDFLINEGSDILTYVPYTGYNIYSFKPIINLNDVSNVYENNHRYIFRAINYEKGKNYYLYIPQTFKNLRIVLNSNKTENVAHTIKSWGSFSGGIVSFTIPKSGNYYLDIWSNASDSESIEFEYIYLTNEFDYGFVNYQTKSIELKSYLNNTVVFNDCNVDIDIHYWQRGVSTSRINGIVTPEMFGAKGDGINNDTQAIQRAINNGSVIVLKNNYFVKKTGDKRISLKNDKIPISIEIPSNKKIIIRGRIITDEMCNVFYSEGSNIEIDGGDFQLADISTAGTYKMGSIALNKSSHVVIKNITSNNALVTTFLCNYIKITDCVSSRTNSAKMNCAIGLHASSHCQVTHNTIVGTHNDGDIICFGNCFNVIIDGNTLFAKTDFWTDTGAQGICLDTACFKCKVINNYLTGYYNPIDIKTWANGNIISNNTLFANKQGITIRRGEQNNLNNTDIISNNLIDIGGGNGSKSEVVGSVGIDSNTYTTCGVYIEAASNILVTGNVIYSTVDTNNSIGIMITEVLDNNTIKICNNNFNNSYVEYQHGEHPIKHLNGIYILVNSSPIKNANLIIENNNFQLDDINNNDVQYFNIRGIKNVSITGNNFYGGLKVPIIKNCTTVIISNNNGKLLQYLSTIDTVALLMLTSNTFHNIGDLITTILNLKNVTKSISNSNTIFSDGNVLLNSGCVNNNDLVVTS